MNTPTEYIVAMGNAFFLNDGFVMAAPILAATDAPDWSEAGEVSPDSDANPVVIHIIHQALTALWVQNAEGERLPRLAALMAETPPWQAPTA